MVNRSHIGHSLEKDIGHLADLIKRYRECTYQCRVARLLERAVVLQTTSSSSSTLRFTNLLSRLLEQVNIT